MKVAESQINLLSKFVKSDNNVMAASFEITYMPAEQPQSYSDRDFMKTVMLKAVSNLFYNFNNEEKIFKEFKNCN